MVKYELNDLNGVHCVYVVTICVLSKEYAIDEICSQKYDQDIYVKLS